MNKQEKCGRPTRQSGYSLTEALVVLAMIGILSVVAVPNFINLNRASKLRASARGFIGEIRSARQWSATRYRPVKFTLESDQTYSVTEGTLQSDGTITWEGSPRSTGELDDSIRITDTGDFVSYDAGTTIDIVWRNDGTAINIPTANNEFVLKSDYTFPKNSMTIKITESGIIKAD